MCGILLELCCATRDTPQQAALGTACRRGLKARAERAGRLLGAGQSQPCCSQQHRQLEQVPVLRLLSRWAQNLINDPLSPAVIFVDGNFCWQQEKFRRCSNADRRGYWGSLHQFIAFQAQLTKALGVIIWKLKYLKSLQIIVAFKCTDFHLQEFILSHKLCTAFMKSCRCPGTWC